MDHNEDFSLVCKTCTLEVCISCVTGSHTGHAFSKLLDSITQMKEYNAIYLRCKVQEATKNMKTMEEGIKAFDKKVEEVVQAITEEGTNIKAIIDQCIAEMIASVKDQSRMERDKLTKIKADTGMNMKAGMDIDKKMCELNKTRNDGKLLQSLQKLTDDIGQLTVTPLPGFPNIQYTVKPANDKDIQQLFGFFKISEMRPQQTINRGKEIPSPKSDYKQDVKPKDQGIYLFKCDKCGQEKRDDFSRCSCGGRMGFIDKC